MAKKSPEYLTIDGVTRTVWAWAAYSPVGFQTIRDRIKNGVDPRAAVFAAPGAVSTFGATSPWRHHTYKFHTARAKRIAEKTDLLLQRVAQMVTQNAGAK